MLRPGSDAAMLLRQASPKRRATDSRLSSWHRRRSDVVISSDPDDLQAIVAVAGHMLEVLRP